MQRTGRERSEQNEYDFVHAELVSLNPDYETRVFHREEMNRIRVFGLVVEIRRSLL